MYKRVGILGSGDAGQALANGFLKYGYEVMIGTLKKEKLTDWKRNSGEDAWVGSFEEAAHFGNLVVLAVKGSSVEFVLDMAGAANLHDKTVIDTSNPASDDDPENSVLRYFTPPNFSLMEHLQTKYHRIHFVKVFSSVGNTMMTDPSFRNSKPTMYICGNDEKAKLQVEHVLEMFGWEWVDMGSVEVARTTELI